MEVISAICGAGNLDPVTLSAFDRIYTMDESNHGNILKLTDSQSSKDKVKMILNETHPGSNMSVLIHILEVIVVLTEFIKC